ncbi:hypothetical protein PSTG_09298 [Puccinia striiformis f. sp. tritici PST-78]|uniref:Uncharacterized protein n=1 Tax=Puccinia striiformis f. sp. tritici PST-78 TaxID=1165861 RepID=A0A0L0VES2_9BASI|nr:hypothetical protein PSTG_09298 [Puccinia striiformis f. sp. tritici PST-78]
MVSWSTNSLVIDCTNELGPLQPFGERPYSRSVRFTNKQGPRSLLLRELKEDYTEAGHYTEGPNFNVSPEMIKSFVKNSAHIHLIQGSKLHETPKDLIPKFTKECEPGNLEYIVTWYLAFEALALYRSRNKGEYPGMRKGQEEGDFYTLCEIVLEVLLRHGWGKKDEEVPKKMQGALREMVRSLGCGLPHISSLVGGLVSPEVMKLVTSQYIPMNGRGTLNLPKQVWLGCEVHMPAWAAISDIDETGSIAKIRTKGDNQLNS